MIMITTISILCHRCSPKFSAPDNQRVLEEIPLLQIFDRQRWADPHSSLCPHAIYIAMIIPRLPVPVVNLHHPDSTFDKSTSSQATICKLPRSVSIASLLRFPDSNQIHPVPRLAFEMPFQVTRCELLNGYPCHLAYRGVFDSFS